MGDGDDHGERQQEQRHEPPCPRVGIPSRFPGATVVWDGRRFAARRAEPHGPDATEPARVERLAWAVVAAALRRDRVVLVLVGLSGATVAGYGMLLPWFDRRLVSHLTLLLVLLCCAHPARRAASTAPSTSTH